MADWNDIKKAFERDAKKAEETYADLEQKLLNAVANYVCSQKGLSSIQGYNPADILAFLENLSRKSLVEPFSITVSFALSTATKQKRQFAYSISL